MEKREIFQYLETKADLFNNVSDKIWDNPETLFSETVSSEILCQALEQEGFSVTRGLSGMDTAFSGTFGKGKPVIAFLGEYDALSNLSQEAGCTEKKPIVNGGNGHGCGHNLLGAGALAGAMGLKKYLEETGKEGTVIYFGCPAEEGGSGKTYMAREGCFKDVDCALTWHPGAENAVATGNSLANYQVFYHFKGVSSHAAAAPEMGRSALDAVELMNTGVQYLREHVVQEARIHYAITDTGGFSPNVVQPTASVLYLIRAPKTPQVAEIYERINKIARGAAMMTETEVEIDFVKGCSNTVPNAILEGILYKNFLEAPKPEYTKEEKDFAAELLKTQKSPAAKIRASLSDFSEYELSEERRQEILSQADEPILNFVLPHRTANSILPGSTDVGDVSWNCPTAQVSTATWAAGTAAHSWQATSVGKSSMAHKAVLYAGQVLAASAIDLLHQPEKIEAAKKELQTRLGDSGYVCPIPAEIKPRKIK